MSAARFDLAIIGAGAAGLQLLYEYYQVPAHANAKVLVIDSGDRTKKSWCFWAESGRESFPFLIEKSWPKITYRSSENITQTETIGSMSYHFISSTNYYRYFFEQFIPQHSQITVVQGWVDELIESAEYVTINLREGGNYAANRVADSRIKASPCAIQQHFWGKFIEFEKEILDDTAVTLMDFSQKQSQDQFTAFHYILPFDKKRALIETTVFSKSGYDQATYDDSWNEYMSANYPNQKYKILDTEVGTIPMCLTTQKANNDSLIFPIGTAGGQVKASTGYAFTRMHRDAKHRVMNQVSKRSARFAFYDSILLHMIQSENHVIPKVMDQLFKKTSFGKILRFLDEKTSLWEEIVLFSRLNIPLFLKHLFQSIR